MSCYKNDSCKTNYFGIFKIDTFNISNNFVKELIKKNRLDTITLISTEKGKYYFQEKIPLLEGCSGNWHTESNNIEGDCTGYIRQQNMDREFARMPFDILIRINNETYVLPFRKVTSAKQILDSK